jgi:small subunit ribosomal protein S16
MLKIRLKRFGKKHRPFYRIVVIKARTKREGNAVAEIGFIDPISKERKIDKEKALYWLGVGAQPTYSVERYLVSENIIPAKSYPAKKFEKVPSEKSKERTEAKSAKKEEAKAADKKEEVVEEVIVEDKKEETKESSKE